MLCGRGRIPWPPSSKKPKHKELFPSMPPHVPPTQAMATILTFDFQRADRRAPPGPYAGNRSSKQVESFKWHPKIDRQGSPNLILEVKHCGSPGRARGVPICLKCFDVHPKERRCPARNFILTPWRAAGSRFHRLRPNYPFLFHQ